MCGWLACYRSAHDATFSASIRCAASLTQSEESIASTRWLRRDAALTAHQPRQVCRVEERLERQCPAQHANEARRVLGAFSDPRVERQGRGRVAEACRPDGVVEDWHRA